MNTSWKPEPKVILSHLGGSLRIVVQPELGSVTSDPQEWVLATGSAKLSISPDSKMSRFSNLPCCLKMQKTSSLNFKSTLADASH